MNILITGATSGIGKQLVLDYLNDGHQVVACGRSQDKLDKLASEASNREALKFCVFDVTDRNATKAALAKCQDEIELDCVILSAGVCEYIDDAKNFDPELVDRVFAANFFGVVNSIAGVLPKMQRGSQLVVVDSMARMFQFTRAEAYGASKAAIHYFAGSLRTDLEKDGIEVITVSPGFVKTPMTDANDFEMPMRVTVAQASDAIRKGIAKSKPHIAFPRTFGFILAFLQRLPYRLQMALSKRMKQS
ncbi:short-chain dehydrogenase [Aliidiomarina iranensis]|uniref:Short-chain dehydrogenase n=1 Tax=Aliidiomarina iranensis TaxID=1434071 RepID=A0A432VZX3_9GAMM|nr:SDR family NAD(P)-dependent oxidoreductase [Aliidiomarina iranensis]RUO22304.1 short-chain dehydrogenase [Aliidiomarina iranensis]